MSSLSSQLPVTSVDDTFDVLDLTQALDEHAIVATTDARGRILRVNDKFCAISKYAREELLGRDHRIINSGRHPPAFFRELWSTISGGKVWKGEICNRAKDGSLYWVATTIVPFLGSDGVPQRYIAIRADISERMRAEQRQAELLVALQKINEELNQFAYVVSHDLKAPLRAISSLANWLAADYGDRIGADGREQFELLLGRVRRMDALVDGILRYSRIGREQEDIAEVDLNEIVAEVRELIAAPAAVLIRVPRPLPRVWCERTRLIQVFENLVSNAVKYMDKPAGEVVIECTEEPDHWVCAVRDNGPGIEAKYFGKIFEIFQTLNRRDDRESTGIGLAVVKKNVEVSGGQVWVESEPGVGSAFYFRLPRRRVRAEPTPSP